MGNFSRKAEDSPQIRIWPMLVGIVVSFCAVSIWIAIVYAGKALKLWLYFAYMTVACTFIPLSTPQMALGYGASFPPALVAILGGIGSCISALIDYTVVTFVFRYDRIARIKKTKWYLYVETLFMRHPFVVLAIAAFTPIPFEPVKLLACTSQYNRTKFLLAVFVGRTPRYFLLGVFGRIWPIPGIYLYGSIIVLAMIEVIRRLLRRRRLRKRTLLSARLITR